mgnify:CR=1 FL=1
MADSTKMTVEIVFNMAAKPVELAMGEAEKALIDAFKQAGNLEGLATRLAVPINLLTVTGAKVVAA